ncbi:MAG: chaperonin GroEL [Planctomycetes bacterium]|nr:chaperonin GroEL [Planctomycetota bacterium]
MTAKKILFEQEARDKIKKGMKTLAKAVKSTLGPRGRNVVIEKSWGAPTITKDGVTVAKEIDLEDPYEDMGAKLVREVASKTNDIAGDGTTTATALAEAIFEEGLKNVVVGANPLGIKNGIDKAIKAVSKHLTEKSKAVDITNDNELSQVGAIAANNNMEIGKFLAEGIAKVGKDGVITIEEAKGIQTYVDLVEGMQFDKGYVSHHFALKSNPEKLEIELEEPYILISEKKISNARDLLPILEQVKETGKSLLVIAEDIEGEALTTLVLNHLRGIIKVVAVKAPGFGDRRKAMLEDIALLTGGTALMEALGYTLEKVDMTMLGRAKKVRINKDNTTIIEGAGESETIMARIEQIKAETEAATSDYDKEKFQERLAKLSGGVAQIMVGAATEVEMKNTKMLIEDALNATRAALEEGILPGGGVALLRAQKVLQEMIPSMPEDEKVGASIVMRALEAPLKQIASNAGVDGSIVAEKIRTNDNYDFGFNADTLEYVNMLEAGIIDPTKVVRIGLENAGSVASLLLTTEALVAEIPEEKKAEPPMPEY